MSVAYLICQFSSRCIVLVVEKRVQLSVGSVISNHCGLGWMVNIVVLSGCGPSRT